MRNLLSPAQGEQQIPRRMKPGVGMTRLQGNELQKVEQQYLPFLPD
jgi:hypothetical protein